MKAAEKRSRCDGAEPLNRPMNRSVLAQRPMSPRLIVVGGKLAKDPAQMGIRGRDIPVGSYRSVSPRTHSATASPEQSVCHGCPWLVTGARQQDRKSRPGRG